jgi:hypothetical protein
VMLQLARRCRNTAVHYTLQHIGIAAADCYKLVFDVFDVSDDVSI